MTREEHLNWAKERALEYLRMGDTASAIASMLSDLGKHPETADHLGGMLGGALLLGGHMRTQADVEKWIQGFN